MSADLSLFHAVREFLGVDEDTATPAEAQALEARFDEWLAKRRITVTDASEHPSRSAPLCKDCKHASSTVSMFKHCAHPAAPINLVEGTPARSCESMRDTRLSGRCGPSGAWFEYGPLPPPCSACSGSGRVTVIRQDPGTKSARRVGTACPACQAGQGAASDQNSASLPEARTSPISAATATTVSAENSSAANAV